MQSMCGGRKQLHVRTMTPLDPAGATSGVYQDAFVYMNKNYIVWTLGLGIIFVLYFAGNPFGVYDDVVIIAGLLIYSLR